MEEEAKNEVTTEEAKTSGVATEAKKAPEPERQDVTTLNERAIATMSYFGFLAIVPFYLKKDSEYCRFHGKQGLLLAIVFFMAQLFTVLDLIHDAVLILQVAIMFWMGFSALSGRWKKVPFLYEWSCQLEEVFTLKSKEEELDEVPLKPEQLSVEPEEEKSK